MDSGTELDACRIFGTELDPGTELDSGTELNSGTLSVLDFVIPDFVTGFLVGFLADFLLLEMSVLDFVIPYFVTGFLVDFLADFLLLEMLEDNLDLFLGLFLGVALTNSRFASSMRILQAMSVSWVVVSWLGYFRQGWSARARKRSLFSSSSTNTIGW